jgi:hypothetical protein
MSYIVKSKHHLKRYNKFIESLKDQNIDGYSEKHHIIPRSMGGTNDKDNLIQLTARQHFIAHWMLWKAYGGKMMHAFHMMLHGRGKNSKQKRYTKVNSKTYEILMKESAEFSSKRSKGNSYALGYRWTEEDKENLRQKRALQVIPKESYDKVRIAMNNKIWMNNGFQNCRIDKEKVKEYKENGFVDGRLQNYINEEYKEKIRSKTIKQWQSVKKTGHSGHLIKVNQN